MRILFAGTPAVAVPALEALIAAGHQVAAVLTRPDAPVGRKRTLTPSPVKAFALEQGIEVIEAHRVDADTVARIQDTQAEAGVVVAYGALLKTDALTALPLGWYNLHFSMLPAYRGAAPVQRALMDGRETTGLSVFQLDEGMDTGPILLQREYPLDHADAGAALEDFSHTGAQLVVEALQLLEAGREPTAQLGPSSHAAKITPADAQIDFTDTSAAIINQVRGVTPAPGAWATMDGKRTKLAGLTPAPADAPTLEPGQLTQAGGTAYVGTGTGTVALASIQPFGKAMMDAVAFLNGRPDARFDI